MFTRLACDWNRWRSRHDRGIAGDDAIPTITRMAVWDSFRSPLTKTRARGDSSQEVRRAVPGELLKNIRVHGGRAFVNADTRKEKRDAAGRVGRSIFRYGFHLTPDWTFCVRSSHECPGTYSRDLPNSLSTLCSIDHFTSLLILNLSV